ncbi:MAG: hypothetical protein ABIO70_30925 [Pseudomonadota bacterium]
MNGLLLSLALVALGWAGDLRTVEPRYVVASPGVVLRFTPGGEVIALVPYGEPVTAMVAEDAPLTVVEGTPGRWVEVSVGMERGWAFDAWLLPMPAPPEPCASLTAWAARWTPAGPGMVEVGVAGEVRRSQSYAGGMSIVLEPGGGELWLPGVGLPQAWAGVRRCASGLAGATQPGWPPTLEGRGLSLRVDARRVRVLPAAGGAPLLTLETVDGGVRARWRE